jgi:hypothetical protein
MKLFKQTKPKTCDIIAIEDIFSFLHEHHSFEEVKNRLKRYDFGTWLPDIGTYFEDMGIKTKLISNCNKFVSPNKEFKKELDKYKLKGTFEDRVPTEADIKDKPIIINVDAFKIRNEKGGPGAHYVVVLKENNILYMYDGLDYNKKIKIDFETLYKYSLDISNFLTNGMWLIIE